MKKPEEDDHCDTEARTGTVLRRRLWPLYGYSPPKMQRWRVKGAFSISPRPEGFHSAHWLVCEGDTGLCLNTMCLLLGTVMT